MSKYDPLWKWIQENGEDSFKLTFAEIEQISGAPKQLIEAEGENPELMLYKKR